MLSPKYQAMIDLVTDLRKHFKLKPFQVMFLVWWYEANDKNGFGFRDILRVEDQLKPAIDLLKEAEKDWQNRMINNLTSLKFPDFFYYYIMSEGLKVTSDFNERLNELLKGELNEYKRFEDVG